MAKEIGKVIASLLGVAILAGGICAAGYCSRDDSGKWFKNSDLASWAWTKDDKPQEEDPTENAPTTQANTWGGVIDNVGNELNAETTYAMPAAMAFYANTPAPLAEQLEMSAPSVTVTCSHNFEFNNVLVDWSVEYPSGASAADVVNVTPTSDGSLTANVSCTAPAGFDTQLTLKATLRSNEEKTATCTIDYVKRIESLDNLNIQGSAISDESGIEFKPVFGNGTVSPEIEIQYVNYSITEEFKADIKSYLKFDIEFQTLTRSYPKEDTSTTSNNKYSTINQPNWAYKDFIKNWETYDTAHLNAIKYAWNSADLKNWRANGNAFYTNVLVDISVLLSYNGNNIQLFQETESGGNPANYIAPNPDDEDISPDLTLNGNFTL